MNSPPVRPRPRPTPEPPAETQWERTRLAWRRTLLTLTAVALLSVRFALRLDTGAVALLGVAAALGGWLAALLLSHRRILAVSGRYRPEVGRQVHILSVLVAGYAVLGVLLVVLAVR